MSYFCQSLNVLSCVMRISHGFFLYCSKAIVYSFTTHHRNARPRKLESNLAGKSLMLRQQKQCTAKKSCIRVARVRADSFGHRRSKG